MRFMICLDWMHSAIGNVIWNVFYSCDKHKAGWITAKRGSWCEITLSYKLEFGRKFSFVTMLLKRCDKKKIVCSAYPSLISHKCQLQGKEFPLGRPEGSGSAMANAGCLGQLTNGTAWTPGESKASQGFLGASPFLSLLARSQHRSTCGTWRWPCSGTGPFPTALRAHFQDKIPTGGRAAILFVLLFI